MQPQTADHQASHRPGERHDAGLARRGDWMITFSGKRFWPVDPLPADVAFRDIGHALSLICRYGGHARRFYSVAEHCLALATWFESRGDRSWARYALLHDGSEAYVGDMVRPLKGWFGSFKQVELRVERAIWTRAGLSPDVPPEVKAADTAIIVDEARELFRPETLAAADWVPAGEPLGVMIAGHPPHLIEREFARAFQRLFPELSKAW